MPESHFFSESEKIQFTDLRLADIEQAKLSWSNAPQYCNMSRLLHRYARGYDGSVFFKSGLITENLDPRDFG